MEQLTLDGAIGHLNDVLENKQWDCEECKNDHIALKGYLEELKQYRDAEKSGLMVHLPCKIGDLLYEAGESEIYTYIVDEIHVEQDSKVIVYAFEYDADLHRVYQNGYKYDNCDFGKTVFLTREEAEKTLKARDSK